MGTRRQVESLSKSQIGQIRANLARRASKFGSLLSDHVEGKAELSNSQIKAAQVVLGHVLPAQQSVDWTDETPDHGNPLEIEAQAREMLRATLKSMTPDEIESLLADQH